MIIPEKRLLLLLSSGFLLLITALLYPIFYYFFYLFYSITLILIVWDFFTIASKNSIQLERTHSKYFSIGAFNKVTIKIENRSTKKIQVMVRDRFPLDFIVKNDTQKIVLEKLHYKITSYYLKPIKKGEYYFHQIDSRVIGLLGLISRQYSFRQKTSVNVYPNIIELKKFINLIHQNRQEQLGYKKPVSANENEFDYLREYQAGDDYKKINWKATAHKRFPVIEVDQKEFNRNILVVLDTGRMMTTQYGYLNKLDYAIDTSVILAAAARERKDYFGMLTFSSQIEHYLPPVRKQNLLPQILQTLYNTTPSFNKSDYGELYRFIKHKVRKNSILFIFTELYNKVVSKELVQTLYLLSYLHKVRLISFEEKEKEAKGKKLIEMTQWIMQQSQYLEKETIIRDLGKKGIRTIRTNPDNIKSLVVNAYLSC